MSKNIKNIDGTLFHIFKSYDRVERFRVNLWCVLKFGQNNENSKDNSHPALISIAKWLMEDEKALTVKQVLYANELMNKDPWCKK